VSLVFLLLVLLGYDVTEIMAGIASGHKEKDGIVSKTNATRRSSDALCVRFLLVVSCSKTRAGGPALVPFGRW